VGRDIQETWWTGIAARGVSFIANGLDLVVPGDIEGVGILELAALHALEGAAVSVTPGQRFRCDVCLRFQCDVSSAASSFSVT
jgi:hypothetical protein